MTYASFPLPIPTPTKWGKIKTKNSGDRTTAIIEIRKKKKNPKCCWAFIFTIMISPTLIFGNTGGECIWKRGRKLKRYLVLIYTHPNFGYAFQIRVKSVTSPPTNNYKKALKVPSVAYRGSTHWGGGGGTEWKSVCCH